MGRNKAVSRVLVYPEIEPFQIEISGSSFILNEIKRFKNSKGEMEVKKVRINSYHKIEDLVKRASVLLTERNKTKNVYKLKEFIAEIRKHKATLSLILEV